MVDSQSGATCNVRVPAETHKKIKEKCRVEGRLMGAYVDRVLRKALMGDFPNEEAAAKKE